MKVRGKNCCATLRGPPPAHCRAPPAQGRPDRRGVREPPWRRVKPDPDRSASDSSPRAAFTRGDERPGCRVYPSRCCASVSLPPCDSLSLSLLLPSLPLPLRSASVASPDSGGKCRHFARVLRVPVFREIAIPDLGYRRVLGRCFQVSTRVCTSSTQLKLRSRQRDLSHQ